MRKTLLSFLAAFVLAVTAGEAAARELLGVAIAKSDDHVYYWYSDDGGQVSAGLTNDPFRYRGLQPFQLGAGQLFGWALMAVAINSQDRVYYWWLRGGDMRVSVGTSQNPLAYSWSFVDNLPANYILLETGISTQDRVYYWWRHRTNGSVYVSVGTSTNPIAYDNFRLLQAATFMLSYGLAHVDIASDDHVYYYWKRNSDNQLFVTAGTSVDPFAYRDVYPANQ